MPGQVVVLGYDPETEDLYWLGIDPAAPHLVLVEVTVESNATQPGTAIESTRTVTDAGTIIWTVGCPEIHTLRLLHEGRGYEAKVRGDTRADRLAAHHPR
ncbi:MAG TPA: hypothetical protein VFI47_20985, partial [Acidimicrobiales bacterium]|nr:hypothetical protein [Acidimicrobiales bacterium]